MTKNNIDYKIIAEDLIWRNASSKETKNKGSNYYLIDQKGYEDRGYNKGTIHPFLCVSSVIHPSAYHELTWKELCIALETKGYEGLISDGHDCFVCPERETCTAHFKDDPEQERCNGWKEEYNSLLENIVPTITFKFNYNKKEVTLNLCEPAKFQSSFISYDYSGYNIIKIIVNPDDNKEMIECFKNWILLYQDNISKRNISKKDCCADFTYNYKNFQTNGICMLMDTASILDENSTKIKKIIITLELIK